LAWLGLAWPGLKRAVLLEQVTDLSLALVQAVAWLGEWSSILSGEKGDVLCGKVVVAMWVFPHIITEILLNNYLGSKKL
jgi:hypothetical protein